MPKAKILDGMKFGRLTAIKYLYSAEYGTQGKTKRIYLCKCDCGNTALVSSCDLLRGHVKSCGCLHKDHVLKMHTSPPKKTHGMSNTRLYQCYKKMIRRCESEPNWINKKICVCEEWLADPQSFFDWALDNGYDDSLTLDRIDPFGNYEPKNCRWATAKQQANNKTNSRKITIGGVTHTLSEWGDISGVSPATISKRIEHGYEEDEWLVPVGASYHTTYNQRKTFHTYITINGETHTLTEWANISGLTRGCIQGRIKAMWPEDVLLSPIGTVYRGNGKNSLRDCHFGASVHEKSTT